MDKAGRNTSFMALFHTRFLVMVLVQKHILVRLFTKYDLSCTILRLQTDLRGQRNRATVPVGSDEMAPSTVWSREALPPNHSSRGTL